MLKAFSFPIIYYKVEEMSDAFSTLSPEEFEAKYDFKRPAKSNDPKRIVFTCKSGMRASAAADKLLASGYENLGKYSPMNLEKGQRYVVRTHFCQHSQFVLTLAVFSGSFNEWLSKGEKFANADSDKLCLIDFQAVQNGLGEGSLPVIDVRNPSERIEPGFIPGTVNVPRKVLQISF